MSLASFMSLSQSAGEKRELEIKLSIIEISLNWCSTKKNLNHAHDSSHDWQTHWKSLFFFGKVRVDSAAMGCECDATWLYWINITVFWLCRARNTFSPNHTSAETFFSAVFKCQNSLASSLFWILDLWPRTNQRTLGYRKRGTRCRVAN